MLSPNKTYRRIVLALLVCGLVLGAAGLVAAKVGKAEMAAQEQMAAYKLFNQKCLSCHVSVADPERPGKTRDGWTIVVKYMDDHYVNLSDQEAGKIIDLLYAIRRGEEKEPG